MRLRLLLLLLLVSILTFAGPVSREAALQKAKAFMSTTTGGQASLQSAESGVRRAAHAKQEPLYVFNLANGGFVIVSGDDRTQEILGYSTAGSFSDAEIPDGLRGLLQEYADGIQYIIDNDIQPTPSNQASRRTPRESIDPLTTTHWNQRAPFNHFCPMVGSKDTPTGCVATAMAQILGYHRWPAAVMSDIPAYADTGSKTSFEAIQAGTAIDWNNIVDTYERSYSGTASEDAVAHLMQYCGQSVKMKYTTTGSSASTANAVKALVSYFDFDPTTARYINRKNYNYSLWQDIIYQELKEKRPVIYRGSSAGGGHSFICDGYDGETDLFHINWGWGGTSDGLFALNLLSPKDQGEGGSTTDDGYNIGQACGIGLQPNTEHHAPLITGTAYSFSYDSKSFTRSSAEDDFTLTGLVCSFYNETAETRTFDVGVRVLKLDGTKVEDIVCRTNLSETQSGYGWSKLTLGSVLLGASPKYQDGDYRLMLVSRENGTEEWNLCVNADLYAINFQISDNILTITNIETVRDLKVTEVQIEGEKFTGEPLTITVKMKNNGTDYRSDVYYYLNPYIDDKGKQQYEKNKAAAFLDVDAGETAEIAFKFTPENAGETTLQLYTSNDGEYLGDAIVLTIGKNYELETKNVVIAKSNPEAGTIEGDTFDMTLDIVNTGDRAFNGKLTVEVIGHNTVTDKQTRISAYRDIYENVTIEAGATYPVKKTFKERTPNANYSYDYYWVRIVKDDSSVIFLTDNYSFVPEGTGIQELPVSPQGQTDKVYTPGGLRVNKPTKGLYIINGRKILVK